MDKSQIPNLNTHHSDGTPMNEAELKCARASDALFEAVRDSLFDGKESDKVLLFGQTIASAAASAAINLDGMNIEDLLTVWVNCIEDNLRALPVEHQANYRAMVISTIYNAQHHEGIKSHALCITEEIKN